MNIYIIKMILWVFGSCTLKRWSNINALSPKKNTGLILLHGSVGVSFLTSSQNDFSAQVNDKAWIVSFYEDISDCGAYLLEIEAPKDKRDLVRISDTYGRANTPYETSDHFYGDTQDLIFWILRK